MYPYGVDQKKPYRVEREHPAQTYRVVHVPTGTIVMSGESWTVVSRIEERLNGQSNGCPYGEPEEIADAIQAHAKRTVTP